MTLRRRNADRKGRLTEGTCPCCGAVLSEDWAFADLIALERFEAGGVRPAVPRAAPA